MSEYIYESYGEPLIDNNYDIVFAREEIVRCRDCKHYGLGWRCDWSCRFVKPNGFCAWGERRK